MSHEWLEIIMPGCDDIEVAIATILKPYNLNESNPDGDYRFWDFYDIGGRFSGRKLRENLDQERLDKFGAAMDELHLTVHGVQWGKPKLEPASQQEQVDRLWQEFFPDCPVKACPYFQHAGPSLVGDVLFLSEVKDAHPFRLIIANSEGRVVYRLEKKIYNGTIFQETDWSGSLREGLGKFEEYASVFTPEYRAEVTPQDDWLVVTVDYHS